MAGFLIKKWRGDLATPQQRVYGPFTNPSRQPREEYNDGNYQGATKGRPEGEPMPVVTPYDGETDDDDGRPVLAAARSRPDIVGEWGPDERISHCDGYDLHHRVDFSNSHRGIS